MWSDAHLAISKGRVLCVRGRDTQIFTAAKKPRSDFTELRGLVAKLVSKATN